MPELPEVEHARSLLERFVVGQRIVKVRVGPDTIVCAEDRPQKIAKTFRGVMEVPDRRGKQLWLPLVDRPAVLVHLGMTGPFGCAESKVCSWWHGRLKNIGHPV